MKLHAKPPQTLHGQVFRRMRELLELHRDAALLLGANGPVVDVVNGTKVHVLVRRGPLLYVKYVNREQVQFLMDGWGS